MKLARWARRHPIWSALILLLAAALAWMILGPKKVDYEYVSAPVERGTVARVVSASGKLRALNTIKVGSEVSGQIAEVYVDFNSRVRRGQPLAVIDATRLNARARQAEAQVQLARAGLAQAEAALGRARSESATQGRDFARRDELADRGFVSRTSLDQSANAVSSARAGVQTAIAGIASARAQIRQSEAELSAARLDLSRTRIVAPASGVIIDKLVEPGATVAASFQTPNLFEIAADLTLMQVEASVDEADIGEVAVGQLVDFTVDAYPDRVFKAVVRQIRQAATESQNVVSYLVILDVDNKDGKLLPGMTANVEIVTGAKRGVTRVPVAALRFRPRENDRPGGLAPLGKGRDAVWVAGPDPLKPVRRPVRVGLRGEEFVEILSGLKPGDKVLVRSRSLKAAKEEGLEDEDEQQ